MDKNGEVQCTSGNGITMSIKRIPVNVRGREQLNREAAVDSAVNAATHNAGMFFQARHRDSGCKKDTPAAQRSN